jgi:molecular chaperone DnaK (HSP70)
MTHTLLRAEDLNEIIIDAEIKKMDEEREKKAKQAKQQAELREAFMSREIHPEVMDRISKVVRAAAGNGLKQIDVLSFPASYCNDRGRRINNQLQDWPESLEGFAKRAYEFYMKELRPLGYKLHAEVVSFPGGIPGEISLFLKW